MTKRLMYVTGTRADYAPMRSTLKYLSHDPEIDLALVVTGMHLEDRHGLSIRLIEDDGLRIAATIPMLGIGDSPVEMVEALARLMSPLCRFLAEARPDGLMVTGDRGEMLSAAICGSHLSIPVLHFAGGQISGSIDDSIRHAITRFANMHFAPTDLSLQNLIRMGEDPNACFMVGLPGADLARDATLDRGELEEVLGFELEARYIVVMQHPVSYEYEWSSQQIERTLDAVLQFDAQVLIFNPNSDCGSEAMVAQIGEYAYRSTRIRVLGNQPREVFASLLIGCVCLVGNSSSGIAECVSLGIPVINVGTRQRGRQRMGNTIDVGYDTQAIAKAIDSVFKHSGSSPTVMRCKNEYLIKGTEEKVCEIVRNTDFHAFVPKRILWDGSLPINHE